MDALLTIGIPTYNRCNLLRELLDSICEQAAQFDIADEVEIVVSDNASTDATPRVVADVQAHTRVHILYHRNPANLGMVKNILKTVELASGQFWMFYGDDDLMSAGALPKILDLIRENPPQTVLLFQQETGKPILSQNQVLLSTIRAAQDYFYLIGNAGVHAIHTQSAQQALARVGIDGFRTAWPQTQLAFLAMAASALPESVLAVPIVSSISPHHMENTTYTAWYIWETSVFSLYRTALDLRATVGEPVFRAACSHVFSASRLVRIAISILIQVTLSDTPQQVQQVRADTRRSLRFATLMTLLPLVFLCLLVMMPHVLRLGALRLALLLSRPFKLGTKLRRLAEAAEEGGKLQGIGTSRRLYSPGDF
jgi:hypothetical protein